MRDLADDALNFSPFAVSAMLDCWACAGYSAEAHGLQQQLEAISRSAATDDMEMEERLLQRSK